MSENNKFVHVLGIRLSTCAREELLDTIRQSINEENRIIVLSGNVYSFNLAYRQPWLRSFFNQADIVRLDGAGLRLGARLLGYTMPGRMTWADFAWDLAEFAETRGFTFFFLGAKRGVAEKAAANLKTRFPALSIVGTHHGYFDKTNGSMENEAVIDKINALRPDILIVGFGMPLQERWLRENWDRIDANITLTGGAVFDYVSGELQRGPRWMTDHGLEWLARLIIEPRRLWKRYIIGNPVFIYRVIRQRIFQLLNMSRDVPHIK